MRMSSFLTSKPQPSSRSSCTKQQLLKSYCERIWSRTNNSGKQCESVRVCVLSESVCERATKAAMQCFVFQLFSVNYIIIFVCFTGLLISKAEPWAKKLVCMFRFVRVSVCASMSVWGCVWLFYVCDRETELFLCIFLFVFLWRFFSFVFFFSVFFKSVWKKAEITLKKSVQTMGKKQAGSSRLMLLIGQYSLCPGPWLGVYYPRLMSSQPAPQFAKQEAWP